ncbi:MAG: type II toxin-antitoxin system RatA family toxin [Gammaproteobacteria bacterium]|nr:MAG: type II toxin-antitoxin system RatA family toxin [Gammaproteobacteria bacterium]TLY88718.1 MAG: type II toxin-antitoxin system RatA family toxin [Gammaproteobacteria bacterium]
MGQCRMREVKRSALVSKPPSELFALINDIESYPQFLPWCTHARVQSRSQREIVATLGVRRGALHGEFTTRNTLEPERSIRMQLVSGPFRTLQGEWRLTPIESNGCRVELTMRFAFRNPLTALLFDSQFAGTIGSLLDAFVARAGARP